MFKGKTENYMQCQRLFLPANYRSDANKNPVPALLRDASWVLCLQQIAALIGRNQGFICTILMNFVCRFVLKPGRWHIYHEVKFFFSFKGKLIFWCVLYWLSATNVVYCKLTVIILIYIELYLKGKTVAVFQIMFLSVLYYNGTNDKICSAIIIKFCILYWRNDFWSHNSQFVHVLILWITASWWYSIVLKGQHFTVR